MTVGCRRNCRGHMAGKAGDGEGHRMGERSSLGRGHIPLAATGFVFASFARHALGSGRGGARPEGFSQGEIRTCASPRVTRPCG